MMGLTFLWPNPWFPLFLAMSFCYSCCNNLILLGLFQASRLFLLLVAWHGHWSAFIDGLLCPFWLSLGHPRPVCFLWTSSAFLLILHSHGLFTNFIGLPWSNNLILILGVYGLAINPYFLSLHYFGLAAAFSRFSTSYTAHRMLFFSFRASLSPLASLRPICLFLEPVIHYSCRLGLMVLLSTLSILCCPCYWVFFLSTWILTNGPQH